MIPSIYKINSVEFKKFYNKGINKNSKHIRVSFVYKKMNESIFSKYTVVVGKKISKSAVIRHKNKRKIYNILKEIYPQFSYLKFVFIFIKTDVLNVDEKEIKNQIVELLSKRG